jgi:hypothetical protein
MWPTRCLGENSPRALVAGSIRFSDLGVILCAAEWESLARSAAEIFSRAAAESGAMLRNISIGPPSPLAAILATTIRERSEMDAAPLLVPHDLDF